MSSDKKLNLEERIALHKKIAEGYGSAYLKQEVQDGGSYDSWKFAEDATYASPYFIGNDTMSLGNSMATAAKIATMEAKSYVVKFSDWKPASFKYWAAENGVVMKTRWEGHLKDGTKMGFFSYSFIDTNDKGEIIHWETHVNEEYDKFLDVAIGVHGPFSNQTEYVEALTRHLKAHGLLEE